MRFPRNWDISTVRSRNRVTGRAANTPGGRVPYRYSVIVLVVPRKERLAVNLDLDRVVRLGAQGLY